MIINQLIAFFITWLAFRAGNLMRFNMSSELPSISTVMLQLFSCCLWQEVMVYYTHRSFHHRWFYQPFHKIHHEFTAPISVTSMNSHPVENIVSNLFPAGGAFPLLGCHIMTAYLWTTIAMISTINDHSGLHLAFLHSSELHDFHHKT